MVIELIELEVVVLMKHEFAKRAALGGAQLWGKLAYSLFQGGAGSVADLFVF
jgi:hypothetical protein